MLKEGAIGTQTYNLMKSLNSLKGLWMAAGLLLAAASTQAQFLRTSYFMEGTHYRQQLNPALAPGRGYLNLPVIGSLNATVNSSSLGYQDIIDIIDNSDDADYFTSADFMNRLDGMNHLNVNVSTEILSAGWYRGKNFWSFNIGLRNDIGASIPKSMFEFLNTVDGLTGNDWNRLRNLNAEVGSQSLRINSYAEAGLGLARNINSRLTVGVRLKALLGVANTKLDINNISVKSNISGLDNVTDWSNLTPDQIASLRGNASINVDASLESSSKLLELKQDEGSEYINELDFGSFGFAGFGGAIDLGASYKVTKHLTVSASILDLGFIKWSKGNTSLATATGSESYTFTAENPGEAQEFADKVSSGEILNYDMLQMQVEEGTEKSRTTSLTSTVVVGAEYSLLNNWLVVGALYTGRFAKPETLNELTFSANIRPKNYFNLAVSYSVLQGAGKTFGAALKLGPLFVGTDYMFLGKNTNNVNAYIGLSIPLNKQKKAKNS